MEAANTLLVAAGSSARTPTGTPTGATAATLVATNSSGVSKAPAQKLASSPPKGRDHRRRHKQSDGHSRNNSGSTAQNLASQQQTWGRRIPGPAWFRRGRFPRPISVRRPADRSHELVLLLKPCLRKRLHHSSTASPRCPTSTPCSTGNHRPPPPTPAVEIGFSILALLRT